MNSMNDERFFDLAMKVIARQCTDGERAELDALLASQPELKAEFERLQIDVQTTNEALPLVEATQATAGELPAYARGWLQTKVRVTLGKPKIADESRAEHELSIAYESSPASIRQGPSRRSVQQSRADRKERKTTWVWLWVVVVLLLVVLPMFRAPSAPVIQLAMLDKSGGVRGSATNGAALLHGAWATASLISFTNAEALRVWETTDKPDAVKIIYDRAAAEVRVLGKWRGKSLAKTFLVESDLAAVLGQAKAFVTEQTRN